MRAVESQTEIFLKEKEINTICDTANLFEQIIKDDKIYNDLFQQWFLDDITSKISFPELTSILWKMLNIIKADNNS